MLGVGDKIMLVIEIAAQSLNLIFIHIGNYWKTTSLDCQSHFSTCQS